MKIVNKRQFTVSRINNVAIDLEIESPYLRLSMFSYSHCLTQFWKKREKEKR